MKSSTPHEPQRTVSGYPVSNTSRIIQHKHHRLITAQNMTPAKNEAWLIHANTSWSPYSRVHSVPVLLVCVECGVLPCVDEVLCLRWLQEYASQEVHLILVSARLLANLTNHAGRTPLLQREQIRYVLRSQEIKASHMKPEQTLERSHFGKLKQHEIAHEAQSGRSVVYTCAGTGLKIPLKILDWLPNPAQNCVE